MLLRRLANALKEQNWTTILIEFVLLVGGVFLGIQAANWNEQRAEDIKAQAYLARIQVNLRADLQSIQRRETLWRQVIAYGKGAIRYAETMYEVGRLQDSATAVRQLTRLDPYFIVAWTRMRDTAISFDQRAEVEEATRQARAALAHIEAHGPKNVEYVRTLGPWALGDDSVAPQRLSAAIAEAPPGEASAYIVARRDVARYNDYVETSGAIPQAYYFANLYRSTPAGHAMLRDPRVKAKLVEYGFVAYWREKGWPAGCRPLGDADFECGLDIAGPGKS